jgi:hypothetical protein
MARAYTNAQERYENTLGKLGYQKIGSGLYSNVFAKPNGERCIKVGQFDQWPHYARWAIEAGYAGNFAPKVYSLKYHDDFYVAVMERLVATMNDVQAASDYRCENNSLWHLYQGFYHAVDDWRETENAIEKNQLPDDLAELKIFASDLRAAGMTGDIHGGNVMVRKDGHLVVIDPSSRRSDQKVRIKNGEVIAA